MKAIVKTSHDLCSVGRESVHYFASTSLSTERNNLKDTKLWLGLYSIEFIWILQTRLEQKWDGRCDLIETIWSCTSLSPTIVSHCGYHVITLACSIWKGTALKIETHFSAMFSCELNFDNKLMIIIIWKHLLGDDNDNIMYNRIEWAYMCFIIYEHNRITINCVHSFMCLGLFFLFDQFSSKLLIFLIFLPRTRSSDVFPFLFRGVLDKFFNIFIFIFIFFQQPVQAFVFTVCVFFLKVVKNVSMCNKINKNNLLHSVF